MKIPKGWPTEEMLVSGSIVVPSGITISPELLRGIFRQMLAAAPTPPDQSIKPCVEPYKSHQCLDCGQVIEIPPAQDDEPVAWIIKSDEGDYIVPRTGTSDYLTENSDVTRIPLYTRPDSELRKAAEAALADIEFLYDATGGWAHDNLYRAMVSLRAALNKGES